MKYHRVTWKKIPTNMTYIYIYKNISLPYLLTLPQFTLLYFTHCSLYQSYLWNEGKLSDTFTATFYSK